jgi:mediator of RNA polymerase II transcription subunit 5
MALDMIALHLRLDELIDRTATGPHFDLNAVGDPQTAVSHIGNIILFIQTVILRFNVCVTSLKAYLVF